VFRHAFFIIQFRLYQQMHKFDLFDINWPTCFGLVWPSSGHYTARIPRITVCQYKWHWKCQCDMWPCKGFNLNICVWLDVKMFRPVLCCQINQIFAFVDTISIEKFLSFDQNTIANFKSGWQKPKTAGPKVGWHWMINKHKASRTATGSVVRRQVRGRRKDRGSL
jgi:hypothetical protein